MDRNRICRRGASLLLCAALLCALSLSAFGEEAAPAETAAPIVTGAPVSILDEAKLTELVEGFLKENSIPKDRVGIGFCLPATGDEWFYNPDTWFYPASVYKVPLMMVLAERVGAGMVSPDEKIAGLDLQTTFEYIIIHSNNDYAHEVRKFLGGDEVWREEAKQYAKLADGDYDPDYMLYCYFSPRYITNVLETLYADPERFPRVLDCMLKADQGHYFRLPDEMHVYDVAQKYGSYYDNQNTNWNHTVGIIYTPSPIILSVMTRDVGNYEWVIGQLAARFKDYALTLEEQVTPFVEEREAQEAERQAAEQAAQEAERQAALEAERAASAQAQAELRQRIETREKQDRADRHLKLSLVATATGLAFLGVMSYVLVGRHRKKKRYEGYRRRFEEELQQESLKRGRGKR